MLGRTIRQFYARGLHLLVQPSQLRVSQAISQKAMPIRNFAGRTRDTEDEAAEEPAQEEPAQEEPAQEEPAQEEAPEPTPEPVSSAPDMSSALEAQESEPVAQDLFKPFSLGNIKQVDSTPDHQPPSKEDTIEGRYAGVLFTHASQSGQLYNVYEDIKYL